jgi:hypothetical protein
MDAALSDDVASMKQLARRTLARRTCPAPGQRRQQRLILYCPQQRLILYYPAVFYYSYRNLCSHICKAKLVSFRSRDKTLSLVLLVRYFSSSPLTCRTVKQVCGSPTSEPVQPPPPPPLPPSPLSLSSIACRTRGHASPESESVQSPPPPPSDAAAAAAAAAASV